MASKQTTPAEGLDHDYAPAIDIRRFINKDFMGMSQSEIDALDKEINASWKESEKALAAEKWQLNDDYIKKDIVTKVGEEEGELPSEHT